MKRDRVVVVAALGGTETLAWASSYYMPAILGVPIARALGVSQNVFFGLFSAALLLSALVGPSVGRMIDRHGGRAMLAASNLVLAAGLAVLAAAHGIVLLCVAWTLLGLGIGMGLYDPAFAALTRLYGHDARGAITGITLIAGFASTIGWPLTAWFNDAFGWRAACLIWALLNILVALPVNWLAIPRALAVKPAPRRASEPERLPPPRGAMPILIFYFSATWFVTGAMAAHLPQLLEKAGASTNAAIAAAALVGPAQVGARFIEFGVLRRFHPLSSARLAAVLHPMGAALLGIFGSAGIVLFTLLHGAGNGMITIAKGTLPLSLFGPAGYGLRGGILAAPARAVQSSAPFLFGLLIERFGVGAVAVSSALSLLAAASLLLLRMPAAGRHPRGPGPRSPKGTGAPI